MKNITTLSLSLVFILFFSNCKAKVQSVQQTVTDSANATAKDSLQPNANAGSQPIDTAKYSQLVQYLAQGDSSGRWPVKDPYPVPGAILPFNRIVAYYGNLYSNKMGALGKWPKKEMIPKLLAEVKKWNEADSVIKSIPALHYISSTAQGSPGKDGKWRFRMPSSQIDTVIKWAEEINALVFLDVQIGLSTLQAEIPLLEKYLSLPNVHLGIDPEFAMNGKGGKRPGSVIGTMSADDINFVSNYLAGLVKKNNIPPKILVVHRFTQGMITDYKQIKLHPETQIVIDMDGWGYPAKKIGTYRNWIYPQPIQFTGFKLFYVNDTEKSGQKEMMSPAEVLKLKPAPIYIQYQ
jgi:hypothetical protein